MADVAAVMVAEVVDGVAAVEALVQMTVAEAAAMLVMAVTTAAATASNGLRDWEERYCLAGHGGHKH